MTDNPFTPPQTSAPAPRKQHRVSAMIIGTAAAFIAVGAFLGGIASFMGTPFDPYTGVFAFICSLGSLYTAFVQFTSKPTNETRVKERPMKDPFS